MKAQLTLSAQIFVQWPVREEKYFWLKLFNEQWRRRSWLAYQLSGENNQRNGQWRPCG
jgi:hypothetical protein